MENTIDVEQIMQQIRAEAAQQPPYEPEAAFETGTPVRGMGARRKLRAAGRRLKAIFARIGRTFVGMFVFTRNQVTTGKNIVLDCASKTNTLDSYVHGDLEERLAALEAENAALKSTVEQLQAQNGRQ